MRSIHETARECTGRDNALSLFLGTTLFSGPVPPGDRPGSEIAQWRMNAVQFECGLIATRQLPGIAPEDGIDAGTIDLFVDSYRTGDSEQLEERQTPTWLIGLGLRLATATDF